MVEILSEIRIKVLETFGKEIIFWDYFKYEEAEGVQIW